MAQERWQAFIDVPLEDASSLEDATGEAEFDAIGGIVTEEVNGRDATAEVVVEVDADGPQQASARAREEYEALRRAAGIGPDKQRPMMLYRLHEVYRKPRHFELRHTAQTLLAEGRNELAVITGQTACEVYIEHVMSEIASRKAPGPVGDVFVRLVSGFSMRDRRARQAWEALTSLRIREAPFWKAYDRHVERRNQIVHKGAQVSCDEAQESLDAVLAFLTYVEQAHNLAVPDRATTSAIERPEPSS